MKYYTIFLFMILLLGCAAPFSEFYQDNTGGIDITKSTRFIFSSDEPKLLRGNNSEKDIPRMMEDGFAMIGSSSFNGGNVDVSEAITQAKRVHASVVLVDSEYKDTLSGMTPQSVPDRKTSSTSFYGNASESGSVYSCGNVLGCGSASGTANANINGSSTTTATGTKTVYVPYHVDRYNYVARYWVKVKQVILGAVTLDLSPEVRQKIGSNKGVIVYAVNKNSPAFVADILKDDILKKIGEKEILDAKSFQDILEQYSGKRVEVLLLREGKEIRKAIRLNSGTE